MNKADNLPMSAEEAAKEIYREYPTNPKDKPDWKFNRDVDCFKKRKAFVRGAKWYEENVLSHHINVLAEMIAQKAKVKTTIPMHVGDIDKNSIREIAKDYINELNLQISK